MINNRPSMTVFKYSRIDQIALEPPPNDVDQFTIPNCISALGGPTSPVVGIGGGSGGMLPPTPSIGVTPTAPGTVVIISSKAPPDRQKDLYNDGGSITSSPPPSLRYQENQKGIVTLLGDYKGMDLKPLTTNEENQKK